MFKVFKIQILQESIIVVAPAGLLLPAENPIAPLPVDVTPVEVAPVEAPIVPIPVESPAAPTSPLVQIIVNVNKVCIYI